MNVVRMRRWRTKRGWSNIRETIIMLQRTLPDSDDPDIRELRKHLYSARISAEILSARASKKKN